MFIFLGYCIGEIVVFLLSANDKGSNIEALSFSLATLLIFDLYIVFIDYLSKKVTMYHDNVSALGSFGFGLVLYTLEYLIMEKLYDEIFLSILINAVLIVLFYSCLRLMKKR